MTKVFAHSEATLAARLVLLALADQASDDGVTWVFQETIAEKAKLDATTVRRAVRKLEKIGELETRKAQRGRKRVNVYRVLMPDLPEVDYDRLPFEIAEPFTTVQDARSSEAHDRANSAGTTVQDARSSGLDTSLSSEPKEEPPVNLAAQAAAPPVVLVQVEGEERPQNLPHNALREACGIDPASPRQGEVVVALNGNKRTRPPTPGIRELFWQELERWADEHDKLEELAALVDGSERFEQALAGAVGRKAAKYRERLKGATMTPTALARWWLDLDVPLAGGSMSAGLSPDDMQRYAHAAAEQDSGS